jgi:hypothetical protein
MVRSLLLPGVQDPSKSVLLHAWWGAGPMALLLWLEWTYTTVTLQLLPLSQLLLLAPAHDGS